MNAPRISSLVLALAVTAWACSGYVADTSVAPGDTVRVTAPSMDTDDSVGTVAALESDTLTVQVEGRADQLALPLASVTSLEVSRGRKSNIAKGAGIGLLAGGASGALFGIVGCAADPCEYPGAVVLFFGVFGGGLGLLTGLVVGAATSGERWEAVPLDGLRVSLTPFASDGVSVSASLRL